MSIAVDGYRRSPASSTDEGETLNPDQTVVESVDPRPGVRVPPPRGHLPPGTRAGDYELAEEVGRGAFGTVYRAVHPIIGKEVAVKVLDSLVVRDEQLERRFVTEARAVNRIKHPNIVDIFGFGQLENGQTFYVMELLVGETLAKLLKRCGALPPPAALEILEPLADALDAAHRVGVLHRDLKPANVFLHQPSGGAARLKLLDFGVAKIVEPSSEPSATAVGAALGTPAYMAPEQWQGSSNSASSDIYSLGIIAYELLTGRRPYRGSGTHELVKAHLFDQPDAASGINPALPPTVDWPLATLLAKRPEERPSSARAAVASLKEALSGKHPRRSREILESQALTLVDAQKLSHEPALGAVEPTSKLSAPTARGRRVFALLTLAAVAAAAPMAWRAAKSGPVSSTDARSTALPSIPSTALPSIPSTALPSIPSIVPAVSVVPVAPVPVAPVPVAPNEAVAPLLAAPLVPQAPPSARGDVAPSLEEQVTLLIQGAPARAVVVLNGGQTAKATEPLRVARGSEAVTLKLMADGVLLRSYSVVPDRDRVITFAPSRRTGPVVRNVHPKSELEF
jgi:serine/threonine protein kinase